MVLLKRTSVAVFGLVLVMVVSACGSTPPSSTGGGYTTSAPTPTPVASTVKTAQATVSGKSVTILTDAQGKTLYYFAPDTATKAACTGACAKAWPPLISTGSGTTLGDVSLPGALSVVHDANGNQVEYNGHLLYTFSGDTSAGQANGEGLLGKWFVCTPGIAAG